MATPIRSLIVNCVFSCFAFPDFDLRLLLCVAYLCVASFCLASLYWALCVHCVCSELCGFATICSALPSYLLLCFTSLQLGFHLLAILRFLSICLSLLVFALLVVDFIVLGAFLFLDLVVFGFGCFRIWFDQRTLSFNSKCYISAEIDWFQ